MREASRRQQGPDPRHRASSLRRPLPAGARAALGSGVWNRLFREKVITKRTRGAFGGGGRGESRVRLPKWLLRDWSGIEDAGRGAETRCGVRSRVFRSEERRV